MTKEISQRRFRHEVPQAHRQSLDTRLRWMWHQRFGTIQTVWKESPDTLDHTAATIMLQAIMARDLESIRLVFQRIEGSAQVDEEVLERSLRI